MGRPKGSKNKNSVQAPTTTKQPSKASPAPVGAKKRGRPSNAELAERARVARETENKIKDQINATSEARIKALKTSNDINETTESVPVAANTIPSEKPEPTLVIDGAPVPVSPTGFFFKEGQLVKMKTPAGEWQNGRVLKHPLDMPELVRVLWDNGAQDWRAAKNLQFFR